MGLIYDAIAQRRFKLEKTIKTANPVAKVHYMAALARYTYLESEYHGMSAAMIELQVALAESYERSGHIIEEYEQKKN